MLHYDVFEVGVGGEFKGVYSRQITIPSGASYKMRIDDLVERLTTKPEDFFR
jgi:hypothetical protein